MDVLGTGADPVGRLAYRRQARHHDRGHAAAAGVVHAAAEILRADVHVHQYELGPAGHHGVAVGGAQGGHFVGADNHARRGFARCPKAGKGFDEGGMVAAQVGEDAVDPQLCAQADQPLGG